MQTIALLAQKGGAGKTTLAINLAVAAERVGVSALILDCDPQRSATEWGASRESDAPVVVAAETDRLPGLIARARDHGAGLAVIDTSPRVTRESVEAAREADLVLMPCRPSVLDLRATRPLQEVGDLARRRIVAVLNGVPPRGNLGDQAAEALAGIGIEVCPVRIGQRAALVHSLTVGLGVLELPPSAGGAAADEIFELYRWVRR